MSCTCTCNTKCIVHKRLNTCIKQLYNIVQCIYILVNSVSTTNIFLVVSSSYAGRMLKLEMYFVLRIMTSLQ